MTVSGDGPVGVIAGGQDLPFEVADSLQAAGRDYFLFGLTGETDKRLEAYPHVWLKWGEIGYLFKMLEQKGIEELLFIGAISSRPDLRSTRLDFGAIKALPEMVQILAGGGDEGVLNGVARFVEKRGLRLVSVPEVAPGLVVGNDLSVAKSMADANENDIQLAANVALAIGAMDAGQGVVVAGGRILAMEGPEGTDQMLERVAQIRSQKKARWDYGKQGLLLKRARPGQDMRFDMPAIGPRTIEKAKTAGLAGIVCAEGEVLCANRDKTMAMAKDSGMFLQARKLSQGAVSSSAV